MREETRYYIDGFYSPFFNKEEAEAAELKYKENLKRWQDNSAQSKYEKLVHELKDCLYIDEERTMVTCSFDDLRIKHLIRICEKFAEDNKEYLKYY